MPAPAVARVRVTVGGAIGGSEWRCGFWFQVASTAPGTINLTTFNTAAGTTFASDVWGALKAYNYSTTDFSYVRSDIYAAGSMASAQNAIATPSPIAGTASGVSAGSQAMVCSLYTATHSRRGRGRVYYPATGSLGGATNPYGFDPSTFAGIMTGTKSFLHDVVTIGDTDFGVGTVPVVQSITGGTVAPITQLFIDSRPDRQELREKSLSFSRLTTAY